MALLRTAPARWFGVAVAVLVLVLPFSPAQRAAAADHSLVFAALHVLEDEYVDPVEPVPLLNAAIAALRKATNQGATALADIPSSTRKTASNCSASPDSAGSVWSSPHARIPPGRDGSLSRTSSRVLLPRPPGSSGLTGSSRSTAGR